MDFGLNSNTSKSGCPGQVEPLNVGPTWELSEEVKKTLVRRLVGAVQIVSFCGVVVVRCRVGLLLLLKVGGFEGMMVVRRGGDGDI